MHTLQACLHDHISIDSTPRNHKVQNLCQDPTSVPPALLHALVLGLGFCLSLKCKDKTPINFDRFCKGIRTHYTLRNHPSRKLQFPKQYVKRGNDWDSDLAPKKVEPAMDKFENRMTEAFRRTSRNAEHTYNLPTPSRSFGPSKRNNNSVLQQPTRTLVQPSCKWMFISGKRLCVWTTENNIVRSARQLQPNLARPITAAYSVARYLTALASIRNHTYSSPSNYVVFTARKVRSKDPTTSSPHTSTRCPRCIKPLGKPVQLSAVSPP
jgi:hypothetical protein